MIPGAAIVVVIFTVLGVLAGWKLRGTWEEIRAAYDSYDHLNRESA